MRWTAICVVACLATVGAAVRAEDPPVAAKPAPSWPDPVFGGLAVSRDGVWLAGHSKGGPALFPVAGGAPVVLQFPKGENVGFDCEFTPDSKWLVVLGEASSVEAQGIPKDRTQAVYFFPVAAPTKRKAVQITLKAEGLDKEVKKYMESKYKNMKTLKGAAMDITPFSASRVLLDRGSVGVELWDAASATKSAAPAGIDGGRSCGLTADASRFVVFTGEAIEVHDVKANKVTATIPAAFGPKDARVYTSHPRFSADGADVVAACEISTSGKSDEPNPHVLRCWSIADGKKKWETNLGNAKYVSRLEVAGQYAAVLLSGAFHLVDLSDGSLPDFPLQGAQLSAATPSADGKGLWVADEKGIRRVELPEPKQK